LLKAESVFDRAPAAKALGDIGVWSQATDDALSAALNDEYSDVRKTAQEARQKLSTHQ
jgi:hypothetical protein